MIPRPELSNTSLFWGEDLVPRQRLPKSANIPVGGWVGIGFGAIIVGTVLLSCIFCIIPMTRKRAAVSTTNTTSSRPLRGRRRSQQAQDSPDVLPAYGEPGSPPLINRGTDAATYDTPSAFGLAARIASEHQHVYPPVETAVGAVTGTQRPEDLPLLERMAQTQRMINQMNKLLQKEPAAGYQAHSVEAMKLLQLQQSIALMSDVNTPAPMLNTAQSASSAMQLEHTTPGPIESETGQTHTGSDTPVPNSLHERMLELQQTLAEIDRLLGTSGRNPLEISVQIQSLRERVSQIIQDEDAAAESTPKTLSGAAVIPDPTHLTGIRGPSHLLQPGAPSTTPSGFLSGRINMHHTKRHMERNDEQEGRENGAGGILGPRELPPPYEGARSDTSYDDAIAGGSSVK